MKQSLLNLICCPICQGQLTLEGIQANDDHIEEGTLNCSHCAEQYPIHKKMPYLISDTNLEEFKAREREGWVRLWQKKGMYENANLDLSFQLPYVGDVWTEVAQTFDIALQEMNLTGQEVILDVGAGQGWASRYFAEKGCTVVATDIVADELFGLGRAWAIMEHANVYFEPLLSDGERLPFSDGVFDVVFFCGALHHFAHFEHVLRQVYRVLKPGGRIIAAGEPAISIFFNEAKLQATFEETEEGLVERRPTPYQYKKALKQVGFKEIAIDILQTYNRPVYDTRFWIWCATYVLSRAVRTRFMPLAFFGMLLAVVLPQKWGSWLAINLNGGNILLRGRKTTMPMLTT
jgi:ubiquinone/menaquinone biosynthesis C-methylase UbiE/uncharacterized protein YbaR (Trm112 family)